MRHSVLFLLWLLLMSSGAYAAQAQTCRPVPGLDQLTANPQTRFLIVGETHGTNETPRLVADLACNLVTSRPITVALEFGVASTPDLVKYLQSDGGAEARKQLLQSRIWQPSFADGRNSQAMFALIEQLRALRAGGAKLRIAAFQPNDISHLEQHYYELGMASNWAKIADLAPDDLMLVLVGDVHASKNLGTRYPFAPAASHLKPDETISLKSEHEGGAAWNCQADGCHAHALVGGAVKPRHVGRFASPIDGFDGSYSVGSQYSASPPALGH